MSEALPAKPGDWSPRDALEATLVVGGVVAGFALLWLFSTVLFLLFAAIVVATALEPLVERLERRGVTHPGAVGGVYAVILVIVIGVIVVAGPLVLDQMIGVADTMPEYYQKIRSALVEIPVTLVSRVASCLPEQLPVSKDDEGVLAQAIERVPETLRYVGSGLRGVLALVAVMLLSFYWSLQEERTIRWTLLLVPVHRRDDANELVAAMRAKVGAYIRGQGILCATMAILTFTAYLIIGLPYAIVLALGAGILEAVPYFGPVLGAIPPFLVALSIDPPKAMWVVVATVLIQQLEGQVLVPRVMDRSVGVNPVVTLLAIAAFGSLLGVAGAVLAIPLAAILQVLLNRFLLSPRALEPPQPAGRDQISVLRYQSQELIRDLRLWERAKVESPATDTDRLEELIESIARTLDETLARKSSEEAKSPDRKVGIACTAREEHA